MLEISQSTTRRVMLKLYLSSDHIAPATGKTLAVKLSKAGAAFADPSAGATTATEQANGWYYVDLSTADTGTLGDLVVRGTCTGCDDSERLFGVSKATNRGMTALPDVASGSAGAVLIDGTGTAAVTTTAGKVLLQATQPGVTIPTVTALTNLPAATTDWLSGAAVKADAVTKIQSGLATPTNITAGTISTVSGSVGSVAGNVSGSVGSVAGNVGGSVASVSGSVGGSVASISGVTFPANFSALAITATTGKVTVGTNSDKTGYTISGTKTTLDALRDFNPASDTVAHVTLVDTCTTNTDMRGTNSAYTGTPPTESAIAAAVFDLATTGHTNTGTFGAAVVASASGGLDPQDVADLVISGLGTVDANVVTWLGSAPNALAAGKVDATASVSLGATAPAGWINTAAFAAGATVPRVTLVDTLTTYTGNTPQTGDAYAIVNDATFGNAQLVRSKVPANSLSVAANNMSYVNVMQWNGAAVATPATSGVPTVALATAPPTAAQIRTEMDTSSTKLAHLDADVSSRSTFAGGAVASVAAPVAVASIAANAVNAAALASDAVTEIQNGLATATTLSTVAAQATAIKSVTDKIDTGLESDGGSGYQATTVFLSNAPTGSGGGGTSGPTAVEIRTEIDANSTQLAAIKSKTDTIPDSPAAVGSAMTLNLTQAVPTTNAAQTVGDALNAARAQGFGKWAKVGTALTLYAADGSTIVRTFTLDSDTNPASRS